MRKLFKLVVASLAAVGVSQIFKSYQDYKLDKTLVQRADDALVSNRKTQTA